MDSIYDKPLNIKSDHGLLSHVAHKSSPLGRCYRRLIDYVYRLEGCQLGHDITAKLRDINNWFPAAREMIYYVWLRDNLLNFDFHYNVSRNNIEFHISKPSKFFIEVTHQKSEDERSGKFRLWIDLKSRFRTNPPRHSITIMWGPTVDFRRVSSQVDYIEKTIRKIDKEIPLYEQGNGFILPNLKEDVKANFYPCSGRAELSYVGPTTSGFPLCKMLDKIKDKHKQASGVKDIAPIYLGLSLAFWDWWKTKDIFEGISKYYKETHKDTPFSGIIIFEELQVYTCDGSEITLFLKTYIFRFKGKKQVPLSVFDGAIQCSVGKKVTIIRKGNYGNLGIITI